MLVLLPADKNKLVLSWKGPFLVIEKRSELDYLVSVGNKVTLFHINMLKKYEERKPLSQQMVAGTIKAQPTDIATNLDYTGDVPHVALGQTQDWKDVSIAPELTAEERDQAREVLSNFRDIFSDLPGRRILFNMN